MFRELMPLLKERTVMLTLSRVDEATIRVCVIPKRLKEDSKENGQENALCAPLAITGTVDELDREFSGQLARYSSSIVKLGANFEEIEAAHEAATKALKAENKKEVERQRGKGSGTRVPPAEKTSGAIIKDGKPVFGSKDGSIPTETGSLFDADAPPLPPPPATIAATAEEANMEPVTKADEPSTGCVPAAQEQSAFA
jgi:PRTRC genetic system protein E